MDNSDQAIINYCYPILDNEAVSIALTHDVFALAQRNSLNESGYINNERMRPTPKEVRSDNTNSSNDPAATT